MHPLLALRRSSMASVASRSAIPVARVSFGIDDEPVAVLHQGMAHLAQPAFPAIGLAVEPRIRIGCRGMCFVGALLAMKVPLAIAAYDGTPTYDAVLRLRGARVVIPPRSNAVERPNAQPCCQRDYHIASKRAGGRLKWQTSTGYGKRALVETAMGRYKGVIGPRLRDRSFLAQQTEAAIGVAILNRMLACGRP